MKKCAFGFLGLFTLVACSGCFLFGGGTGNDNDNDNDNGNGGQTEFESEITGDDEVPPVETEGSGSATYTLDEETNTLTFDAEASGLSGPLTAAHFHQAPLGVDGDIVFDLMNFIDEDDEGNITISGDWELTDDQLAELLDGNIYINLHTDLNPGGEIRGQVEEVE